MTEQQDPITTDFLRWSNWLPHPVVLVQRDGRWRAANRHWQIFSGLTLGASLGSGWQQALHPDNKSAQLEHWNACCHANTTTSLDMEFGEAASGRYLWHHVMLQPLDPADETGLLIATLTPMGAGKDREAALQARIAVNEERIDALELANAHLLEESALYHQTQQQLQAATVRLNHVIAIQSELAGATLDLNAFLQLVVDRVRDVSPANIAIIEMVEGDELVYGAASGLAEDCKRIRVKTNSSLAGLCVQTKRVQVCSDAATHHRVDQAVCAALGVQSLLAVPIIRAGEAIGVLMLMAKKKRAFRQVDTQTAQMLAGLTASAIEHQFSFDANQQLLDEKTQALDVLEQEIHHRKTIEADLADSVEHTRKILETSLDAFIAIDSEGVVTSWNLQAEQLFGWQRDEAVGKTLSRLLIPPNMREAHDNGMKQFLSTGEGPAIGKRLELMALTRDGGQLPIEITISAIESRSGWMFYAFLHDISRRKQLIEQLRQMAHHDSLTGLPNRLYFYELMERAFARYRRSGQLLAVLFLDVDRFKQVNDVHGHEVGDILLQAFAQRLQQLVREIDTVARLGGDEFVILLEDLPSVDVACTVAAKVVEAMRVPFAQGDHELQVGTSIGIAALTSPDLTPDEIVSRADNAMYQAKSAGRNTFRLFQP